MAELYGKETGCLGGRGGHMHLADFTIGLYGSNGIVGGGLGIAMGASLGVEDARPRSGGAWILRRRRCEYRTGVGDDQPGLDLAATAHRDLREQPLRGRDSCRAGNCIGDDSRASGRLRTAGDPGRRPGCRGDVSGHTRGARTCYRGRRSYALIEALTYRYKGHNTGDGETYRTSDEVEEWRTTRDPIERLVNALQNAGMLTEVGLEGMIQSTRETVAEAVEFAEESPWPDVSTAADRVTALDVRLPASV